MRCKVQPIGFALLAHAVMCGCAIPASRTEIASTAPPAAATSAPTSAEPDPFHWLEEVEGDRALAWVHAQNDRSLGQLTLDPRYQRYYEAALAIAQDERRIPGTSVFDSHLLGGWVYNLWQDERHPRGLWRRARLESYLTPSPAWQELLDVDALAQAEGKSWVFRAPQFLSSQSRRCMIMLSDGGKDTVVYREFDVESLSFVKDGFILPEATTRVLWKDDNTLLVATDWEAKSPTPTSGPYIVKEWSRGQALSAAKEIYRGQVGDLGVFPEDFTGETGERLFVLHELHKLSATTFLTWDANGQLAKMALPAGAFLRCLHRGELIFSLQNDWMADGQSWKSGSLLSVPVAEVTRPSPTVRLLMAPGPRESIYQAKGTSGGVLVVSYSNARGKLLRFTFEGSRWSREQVPLPDNGTIKLAMSDSAADTAFVTYESFLQPTTLYAVGVAANRAAPAKTLPAQFDGRGYLTEQLEATSKDGTRVPYFVVRPKALEANGQAPALMYGYGGFGVPLYPSYSGVLGRLWLDQGGVYVLANIRGGGEFGPAWHEAARKARRQAAYDDFIAVAEDLIRRKITSPRHLGIHGLSNGGLLMGVMLTQRPGLFNAAVVEVAPLDMITFSEDNAWANEFGSLDVPDERVFLERISPYQNLRKRSDFPVPFFVTSTKDDRVPPGHARKFAAKMEALGMPFLYYESPEGGHGLATTNPKQQAMYEALIYTYLARQLSSVRRTDSLALQPTAQKDE